MTYIFYDNRYPSGTHEIGRLEIAEDDTQPTNNALCYREAECISGVEGIPMDEIYWEELSPNDLPFSVEGKIPTAPNYI